MHHVGFSHFPQPHPDPPRKIPSEKLGEPPGVVIYQAFIMVKIRENTLTRIRLGHNAVIVPLQSRAYKRAFQRAHEMALLKPLGNLRENSNISTGTNLLCAWCWMQLDAHCRRNPGFSLSLGGSRRDSVAPPADIPSAVSINASYTFTIVGQTEASGTLRRQHGPQHAW